MAKPFKAGFGNTGNPGQNARPRPPAIRSPNTHEHAFTYAIGVCVGLAVLVSTGRALAQPAPQSSALQEQRRAEERERAQREQQERTPEVRLQPPAPAKFDLLPTEQPCFVIQQLTLKALPNEAGPPTANWDWALDGLAGPAKDDSPLQRCVGAQGINLILTRLQNAILARGFVTTRVLAAPQDLSTGVLALTVVEGRIRAIRFSDESDGRGTSWNAVPAKPGDLLNIRDIEQALENFKRVPTAEADIRIEEAKADTASQLPNAQPGQPGQPSQPSQPGLSDLVISYRQPALFRAAFFADDSGTSATGKYQGGVTVSLDNWFRLNDLFYFTLNNNLGGGGTAGRGTHGNAVHYSVPLGYWSLGATASTNQYFQTVAGISQNYVYRGSSSNAEVKLSRLVYRDASRKTTLNLKAFQRKSNNYIDDTEVAVQRRVVGGWELGAGHKEFIGRATLEGNLAYKRGTGAFGSLPAPEEAFGEGASRFALTSADITLNIPFKLAAQSLRYNASWRGQYNHTRLTPQDRFSIGGRYSVRGFDGETVLSAERGWWVRNELGITLADTGQEAYIGLDYGQVGGPSSDLLAGKHLAGAVLGLRGSFKKLQYDIFIGAPVSKPALFRTAGTVAGISLNYSF